MLLTTMIRLCNQGNIASDYVRAPEIYTFMDKVIADINRRIQATYPPVSEYADFVTEWNAANPDTPLTQDNYSVIPDRFLRNVMPVGVARYYYMRDEEGESVGSDYFRAYETALFEIERDLFNVVPVQFQNTEGGYITSEESDQGGGFYYGDVY